MRDVKSAAGSLRAERAAATRLRIEDAARARFARDGYATTTLRAIAQDAGVAIQTVFAIHGSKPNLVRALVRRLRDDPAADAAYAVALAAPTADEAIAAFARSIRLRWEAGHDIVAIHAEAASADPTIRAESAAALAGRRRGIAALAGHLTAIGAAGDPEALAAVLDALTLPEVYAALTVVHRWSADRYEAWLRSTLLAGVDGPMREGRRPAGSRCARRSGT